MWNFILQEVSQICTNRDGAAIGVTTKDGREINANAILSNATPQITYQHLLPDEVLPAQFKTAVSDIDYSSPVTKINGL